MKLKLNSIIFRMKILHKIGDMGEFCLRIIHNYFSEHMVLFFKNCE